MKDDDILKDAREAFNQCEDNENKTRELFAENIEFSRLGKQWPEKVEERREQEGRPCLTINRMPSFIRQVVNDSRLNKPAIRVRPVDSGADIETAKIIDGLIRHIEAQSDADAAYDTAIDFAVTGGFGYLRVDVDYACDDTFDMDIKIDRVINPLTIYGDPRGQRVDSSDWNLCFETETLSHDEFEKRYKGAEKVDWDGQYRDVKDQAWFTDNSVRVADYWTRDEVDGKILKLSDGTIIDEALFRDQADLFAAMGVTVQGERPSKTYKVRKRIITGAEVLADEEWAGKYIPIIPVYGDEVIVDGHRQFHSLFHHAKDAQRMFNFWRTASTELVALAPKAPYVGPAGAFDSDAEKWATANQVSHPYLQYDGQVPPQRQPFAGPPAGALQEALNASDDMKSIMGIYDASLGARSNETSGRAIMARQREGDVSTFHFIDNLSRAIRHAGRVIVDLIPHVYTEERMIRILGEDDTPSETKVNGPVPVMENGQPVMEQTPEGPKPRMRVYDLTTGKYDVTVKSGPSFTSKREEAATQMMELVRTFPDAAPVIGDLLAKNLDWPGADEIAERLKRMVPQQVQGPDPEKQQMQATIQQGMQKIQQLETDRSAEQGKMQIDAEKVAIDREKLKIEMFKAETDRMQAQASMMQPVSPQLPY